VILFTALLLLKGSIMMALTCKGLAEFALSKLGTPYVYGAKGSDGIFTEAKFNSLSKSYPKMFTPIYKMKAKKFIGKICCDCK
jgi:predicted Abi (CAAX) family protease